MSSRCPICDRFCDPICRIPQIPKDKRMPMTSEQFYKIADRDNETILKQKVEISRLEIKVNQLQQKLKSHNRKVSQ